MVLKLRPPRARQRKTSLYGSGALWSAARMRAASSRSVSFFSITYAGNGWYFFADADQGGATHAIEEGGTELIPLV